MNPKNAEDRVRLIDAMRYWHRYFEPFHIDRAIQIEEFATSKQAEGLVPSTLDEVFFNLIQTTAIATTAAVAYNAPVFCAGYEDPSKQAFAKRSEAAVNKYMKWIKYDDTLRQIILDARFGWGVRQIHLGESAFASDNALREAGVPQIERLEQPNFLWDGSVSRLSDSMFQASRYQMVYKDALKSERFNKTLRQQLRPLTQKKEGGSDRHPEESSVEEMVELIDVYFPRERIVCTWPASQDEFTIEPTDPLCIHPWTLTREGPYSVLSLLPSPGRLIPTSPMDSMENLFLLFNQLWRSMAWEALNEKKVFTYDGGGEDAVARVLNARNREVVRANKDQVGMFDFPGVSQSKSMFAGQVFAMAKEAGGNINFKAGLGPSSGTAAQDAMISERVGIIEAEERRLIQEFVSRDGNDIFHLLFDDPNLIIPATREIEGTDYEVDATWYPPDLAAQLGQPRQGRPEDYEMTLVPYSMEYLGADQKIQAIDEALMACANAATAAMPLAQMGINFDIEAYMEIRAKLRHMPELKRLFYFTPPTGGQPTQMEGSSMKPAGPREYIRRNVSERTNDGSLMQLMQHTGGAGEQPVMQ